MDVHVMKNITTTTTLENFHMVFATHGLPQKVVTDNGPSFMISEFKTFMANNGIKLVTASPYHPSSNRLAERVVQSFKVPSRKFQETYSGQTI